MNREDFLARVRQAAAAGRAYRVGTPDDLPRQVGYLGAGPDPTARLAAEVDAVGGRACLVDDAAAARQALAAILDEYSPTTALCWEHPLLDQLEVPALLAARGIEAYHYADLAGLDERERRRRMLAAQLGITSVSYAVAESGTIALASEPGRERVASLLPPVHVAIVEPRRILPDLFDLFAALETSGADALASNLVLVTGPSKTGDVELRLTTGVHGPKAWHVIILRQ